MVALKIFLERARLELGLNQCGRKGDYVASNDVM